MVISDVDGVWTDGAIYKGGNHFNFIYIVSHFLLLDKFLQYSLKEI
jgi:hypothetical protein